MKHVEFRYAVQSFHEMYLVNSQDGLILKSENDFTGRDEFVNSLVIFSSPEDAEEFIWKHSLLNIDVTLRPVLL